MPTEGVAELVGIKGITDIVPGTVGDEGDEIKVAQVSRPVT